jgi:ParB-like chromosome segregation protein Spo0J
MTTSRTIIRDRIRELRRVPASELLPHPRNWRLHPASQRAALEGVLSEVGFADALLARELPDGRLELLDGHLRAETAPDQLVPVLVLDVDEAEANKILLTLDPLAAMADVNQEQLDSLLREVETGSAAVEAMLAELAADAGIDQESSLLSTPDYVERFCVVIECGSEPEQLALLARLEAEGLECQALIA